MRTFRLRAPAFGLLAAALMATPSLAQTVTVGTPNTNNCLPFSCAIQLSTTRYQQVYGASAFSGLGGPAFLSTVTFFDDPGTTNGLFSSSVFTIFFSTTSAAVNALSTTLGANVGGDNALFGVFSLPGGTAGSQFTLTGTPFRYDRLVGNLLMDITWTGGSDGSPLEFLQASTQDAMSRAYDFDGGSTDGLGLITRFTFTSVTPEPATMTLLATGLVGMVAARRRRRKA